MQSLSFKHSRAPSERDLVHTESTHDKNSVTTTVFLHNLHCSRYVREDIIDARVYLPGHIAVLRL